MSTRQLHHILCVRCGIETLHNACKCITCGHELVKPSIKVRIAYQQRRMQSTPDELLKYVRPKNRFASTIRAEVARAKAR